MRRFLILSVLMVFLHAPVLSQSVSDWQVIVHNNSDGQVYHIRPDGVSTIALPTSVQPIGKYKGRNSLRQTVVTSFDGQYVAYMDTDFEIHITNVQTGECCQSIRNPSADVMDQIDQMELNAVSLDGTAILLSSLIYDLEAMDDSRVTLGNFMINANGEMEDIQANFEKCLPLIGYWQPDGIEVVQPCERGDAPVSEYFQLWNPTTGWGDTTTSGIVSFGEFLPLTGEYISLSSDVNYPYGSEPGLHSPLNTLVYYETPSSSWNLVFVGISEDDLRTPYWVADGQAVLIHGNGVAQADLVYRDGHHERILFDNTAQFIAGTPDGWLSLDKSNNDVLHFIVGDNHDVAVNNLGNLSQDGSASINTIYHTPLGASISQPGFATVPQILVTSTPAHCSKTLYSRLQIGNEAHVVPGPANNVRSQPTTSSENIGQIPGGEYFMVLDGPICANDMAWWQVDYQGLIGWTAEGQGDTYWLDPARG